MSENIATMTSIELFHYIEKVEDQHRKRIRSLKALMRAREAEEEAKEAE